MVRRLLPGVILLTALAGCSFNQDASGIDATSDGLPIVRNCGRRIQGVRALDADTGRIVWAANVGSDAPGGSHAVSTVTLGRLPEEAWIEIAPLDLEPRPAFWSFEIYMGGDDDVIHLADRDIDPGFVARPGHRPDTTTEFRSNVCDVGTIATVIIVIAIAVVLLSFGALAFWVIKIVEIARTPDYQFRAAGSEKTTWLLVVVLTSYIGMLIWQFGPRKRVLAAKQASPYPPGWYQSPDGMTRWWDGYQWTNMTARPPESYPPPPPRPPA